MEPFATPRTEMMTLGPAGTPILTDDEAVVALVRLAARVAAGTEAEVREGCAECVAMDVPLPWVEEMLLQSYLFCGFPRTLNATREWRRVSGVDAPVCEDLPAPDLGRWRTQGEATCAIVYGRFYEKLRKNIATLHPALDEWMIVEGYGKTISRPGLELRLRELCVVAACVAAGQDRQLHSHLHGASNAGASEADVRMTFRALVGVVGADHLHRARLLFDRVLGKPGDRSAVLKPEVM